MKYELKKPIQVGEKGEPITALVFREEMVAGDLRGIKMGSMGDLSSDDILKIAGRLCAQPDIVMNKLSIPDFAEVVKIVLPLLQGGPPTAIAPSPS